MNVLFYSPAFYPGIGGVETVAAMIAEGMAANGCHVRVVTTAAGNNDRTVFPFELIRSPSPFKLLSLVRWSDVFFHHNVSLKGLWPLFVFRRPWVVAHHNWYARSNGTTGWQDRLKRFAARFATNIAVSSAVAKHLAVPCTVIPNPYRDDLFRVRDDVLRDKELVFLGRLVSDKGCNILLDALPLLAAKGIRPGLTIIGSGPEEQNLREQVHLLGLDAQVVFAGRQCAEELVRLLNMHTILVVPSTVQEGFGLVALEGLACGCVIIASDSGGLSEAVGPCGVTFHSGNVVGLAGRLAELLLDPEQVQRYRAFVPAHLAGHRSTFVVKQYLRELEHIIGTRNTA